MSGKAAYWAGHLAAIKREGISTKAYAEREGLEVQSLYGWRHRLGAAVGCVQAHGTGSFVAVELTKADSGGGICLVIGSSIRLELAQLPSVEWLAHLAASLARGAR